ncbi:MAG: YebC/PmpR family DNA-binding transcriptional regulator [Ignavibacteriales bacterium]|nr:YebC/PmpR family DNA-binding transcriptional regulator [Ignavibacteriales bacterium]
MSGHSKWATIRRKKAVLDAKRGKTFTRLIKELMIATRQGGSDTEGNPRLRLAIDNAKAANMPADNIERAIKKAAGELEGQQIIEVMYEGYGPGGAAIVVEAATDNKNRTVQEVRHWFSKIGGNMAESNAVAWMFEHKGIITVKHDGKSEDEMMEILLEAGADDFVTEDEFFEVRTSLEEFEHVRRALIDKSLTIENASLQWVAKTQTQVGKDDVEKFEKLIEALEDCDDVQNVYTNAEFAD